MSLIAPLFPGPIDVVGDVHGEIDALEMLLGKLGYRDDGRHPAGRRLVFLGDLIDRGPDSPAVLDKVMRLVGSGRAQCILGNHEINLLLGRRRHGNEWFIEPDRPGEYRQRPVPAERREAYLKFLRRLPVVLERDDLRVVHACWHAASIGQLRAAAERDVGPIEVYREFEHAVNARVEAEGLWQRWHEEHETHAASLKDRNWPEPVLLSAHAAIDEAFQMGNAVRVLVSGIEVPVHEPFWASGKWRMVTRSRWWEDYDEPVPVIVGHYWRRLAAAGRAIGESLGPDLFDGIEPHHWMGRRGNVYCVDFSVGGRPAERGRGQRVPGADAPPFVCQLAAVRVPEWQVVHDDHDEVWALGEPGRSACGTSPEIGAPKGC